jgi:hypothetical protein
MDGMAWDRGRSRGTLCASALRRSLLRYYEDMMSMSICMGGKGVFANF